MRLALFGMLSPIPDNPIRQEESANHLPTIGLAKASWVTRNIDDIGAAKTGFLEEHTGTEDRTSLLLEEMAHRNKNDLFLISSVLNLQARGQKDPKVRAALESAAWRVSAIIRAQDRLHKSDDNGVIDLSDYLYDVCDDLVVIQCDVRPIDIRVIGPRIDVPTRNATTIGLIVNELVTNALKHAFPDNAKGTIEVDWAQGDHHMILSITDDGVGYSSGGVQTGAGTRLIHLLVNQLKGDISREPTHDGRGCRALVTIPASGLNLPVDGLVH